MTEHIPTTSDIRAELDQWIDMWDEVQKNEPKSTEVCDQFLQEEMTPNPVYPDSAGPDHETTPPVWASEDLLKEIEGLKNRLFEVENRLAKMGGDAKWTEKSQVDTGSDKLYGEIKSLREKIEKLSSNLGIEHEKSPWVVKRD